MATNLKGKEVGKQQHEHAHSTCTRSSFVFFSSLALSSYYVDESGQAETLYALTKASSNLQAFLRVNCIYFRSNARCGTRCKVKPREKLTTLPSMPPFLGATLHRSPSSTNYKLYNQRERMNEIQGKSQTTLILAKCGRENVLCVPHVFAMQWPANADYAVLHYNTINERNSKPSPLVILAITNTPAFHFHQILLLGATRPMGSPNMSVKQMSKEKQQGQNKLHSTQHSKRTRTRRTVPPTSSNSTGSETPSDKLHN